MSRPCRKEVSQVSVACCGCEHVMHTIWHPDVTHSLYLCGVQILGNETMAGTAVPGLTYMFHEGETIKKLWMWTNSHVADAATLTPILGGLQLTTSSLSGGISTAGSKRTEETGAGVDLAVFESQSAALGSGVILGGVAFSTSTVIQSLALIFSQHQYAGPSDGEL